MIDSMEIDEEATFMPIHIHPFLELGMPLTQFDQPSTNCLLANWVFEFNAKLRENDVVDSFSKSPRSGFSNWQVVEIFASMIADIFIRI